MKQKKDLPPIDSIKSTVYTEVTRLRDSFNIKTAASDFSAIPDFPYLMQGVRDTEKIIPEKTLSLLMGAGGKGKSRFALQLALSISEGIPLFNRWECRPCKVLYVSLEDPMQAILRRIHAIRPTRQQGDNLQLWEVPAGKSLDDLISNLASLQGEENYSLIIIDPLITLISREGIDENSNKDMQGIASKIRDFAEKSGVAVLVVHHTNKQSRANNDDGETASRGASSFLDASRFAMYLQPEFIERKAGNRIVYDPTGNTLLKCTKNTHWKHFKMETLKMNDSGVFVRSTSLKKETETIQTEKQTEKQTENGNGLF